MLASPRLERMTPMALEPYDLTDRFHTVEFMQGGPGRWAIDRTAVPFRNIAIHHSTEVNGFAYGVPIEGTTRQQEEQAILALALDHRARFGIGPGYNYIGFQSGRLYAVGKAGTERRHTSNTDGRSDGNTWNRDTLAFCMFGGFEQREPSQALKQAIRAEIDRARGWSIMATNPRIDGHRGYNPRTSCPGDRGMAFVRELQGPPSSAGQPSPPLSRAQVATGIWTGSLRITPGEIDAEGWAHYDLRKRMS